VLQSPVPWVLAALDGVLLRLAFGEPPIGRQRAGDAGVLLREQLRH
jgi:hypothetical protein